jgi:hypothetical protein
VANLLANHAVRIDDRAFSVTFAIVAPMKRLLSRVALAVLLAGSGGAPPAHAAFLTGNDLLGRDAKAHTRDAGA